MTELQVQRGVLNAIVALSSESDRHSIALQAVLRQLAGAGPDCDVQSIEHISTTHIQKILAVSRLARPSSSRTGTGSKGMEKGCQPRGENAAPIREDSTMGVHCSLNPINSLDLTTKQYTANRAGRNC